MKLKLDRARCFYNPIAKVVSIFYLTASKQMRCIDIPLNCELEPISNKVYCISIKDINVDEFINYVSGFESQNKFKSFISYLFNKYHIKISLVN